MSGAAVIAAKQNRYLRTFVAAGAVSAQSARALPELGVRESWVFRRMVKLEVFRRTPDGRYYLDQDAADLFRARRRMTALTMFLVGLAVVLVLFLMSRH